MTTMVVEDAPPLSRFLRMAVVAGVESAVQIHIDRGDDLNARDHNGQTPLMIAAGRNRATVCKLLLAAGADANLLDPSGCNALGIAQSVSAFEAASAIEAACPPSHGDGELHLATIRETSLVASDLPTLRLVDVAAAQPNQSPTLAPRQEPAAHETANIASDDGAAFDLSGWEADENPTPPDGDLTLAKAAAEIQAAIDEHLPIDTSADWDDFEAFLPDRATPLPSTDDAEARERLRLVLLRAIREGSVPLSAIEDITHGENGEPDAEAGELLGMVINDLGAETDERFEYSTPYESFEVFVAPDEKPGEEDAVAEALAFVDDLATRRNEPLRLYLRELQREALLTAEGEVALGQAMEHGIEKALDALAAWPSGLAATLTAARQVTSGTKPLRWLSSGPQIELQEAEPVPDADIELPIADGDATSSEGELSEFCAKAELLSGLALSESQAAPEWKSCRGALASLGLTRGFLMELAETGLAGESTAVAFAHAMQTYRRARNQMIVANLKLVHFISKKYVFSGQPLDDLLQEGNIGLIKAVDRYDWRRGLKFSTYATWWIRQHVGRYVADKGKTIRLPVHVYEKSQRIAQAARAFELSHGQAASIEAIAALVELPINRVEALTLMGLEPLPLHELPEIDGLIAVYARGQFTACDPMECIEHLQLGESLDYFLSTLKLKEENVVRMRYGIGVHDSMTLEEIGARFDVTRERIRQIEAKALKRLKHPVRLNRFLAELGLAPASKLEENIDAPSDSDEEDATEAAPQISKPTEPKPKLAKSATARPERRTGAEPKALDKLMDQAREAGITVEDYLQGGVRRLWVHIANTPDKRSRKIARKLITLGFEFQPGKGYWR